MKRVTACDEMPGHGCAHDAEADEADIRHVWIPLRKNAPQAATAARERSASSQPSPASVVVFGLYSQPTQPR